MKDLLMIGWRYGRFEDIASGPVNALHGLADSSDGRRCENEVLGD
jgi:hypothetical protein